MGLTKDLGSIPRAITVSGSNNNVGIGTGTPDSKLNVVTSGGKSTISIGDTAAGTYSQLLMYGGSGRFNWSLGAQYNVSDAFEITRSTVVDGTTFSSPSFVVNSAGNVGIGTTSPAQKLQINGPLALSNLAEDFTTNQEYAYPILYSGNLSGLGNGELIIQPRTTATRSIRFVTRGAGAVSSNNPDTRMMIRWDGNVGIGTTMPKGSLDVRVSVDRSLTFTGTLSGESIISSTQGDVSSNLRELRISSRNLYFNTGDATTTGTQRMVLTQDGNLGIGVADLGPDGVSLPTTFNYAWSEGSGNAYATLFRQRNSAATVIASGYKRSNTGAFASSFGTSMSRAAIAVGSNNGSIAFFSDAATNVANGTDITPSERMTILSNGNVGIANTNPLYRLDIRGVGVFGSGGGEYVSIGNFNDTFTGRFSIITTNNHGSHTFASNLVIDTNHNLIVNNTHGAMTGAAIVLGGNGYTLGTNTIAFFSKTPGTATAGTSYAPSSAEMVLKAGNVGIGIQNPSTRLAVSGKASFFSSSNDYALTISNTDSNGYGLYIAAGGTFPVIDTYSGAGTALFRVSGGGVIFAQNTSVQSISDIRTKENIRDSEDGLDVIMKLRPVRFDFKEEFKDAKNELGFIAQEVEEVFPEIVSEWKDYTDEITYKTLGQGGLIPVLVKAIQELTERIKVLENK
jgi:hypothetical protein